MKRYRNLGGNSGVVAYEIGDESIAVEFQDGAVYLYSSQSSALCELIDLHGGH